MIALAARACVGPVTSVNLRQFLVRSVKKQKKCHAPHPETLNCIANQQCIPRIVTVMIDPCRIWNVICTVRNNKTLQILCLPRETIFMRDLHQTWNVIYNARSIRNHHQILLCLARRLVVQNLTEIFLRTAETSFAMRGFCGRSETIRDRSDHESDQEPVSP